MKDRKPYIRIQRLTADVDNLSKIRLYWCLMIFIIFGYKYKITVKLSNSKHGQHIIVWCKHKGLSRNSHFLVRILAGDHILRVQRDKQDRMIQILWDEKLPISKFIKKLEGEKI